MATPPDIKGFFGPYRFLSNFHFADVKWNGETYRTTEHAYQAAKHLDPAFRAELARYDHPRDAKKAAWTRPPRDDWDQIKVYVMYTVNWEKYKHADLRQWLLDTGDAYLEETNTWGDIYWGVCNGTGQNMLGQTLMLIRDSIRHGLPQVIE